MLHCPICGHTGGEIYKRKLVECLKCGMVYQRILPQTASPYTNNKVSTSNYFISTRYFDMLYADRILKKVAEYVVPGDLLDIGCNVGSFMLQARKAGWVVAGIDPNPSIGNYTYDLPIYTNHFNETFVDNHKSRYDLIYIGGTIEHIENPRGFICLAKRLLKKGGIIVITTCDIDHWLTQRYQIKPFEHVSYFNEKTIELLFRYSGIEILLKTHNSRNRDFVSLSKGTSRLGVKEKIIITLIKVLHLNKIASYILSRIAKDELFVIGRY